jgi:uncharacterized lipoprotein YajG
MKTLTLILFASIALLSACSTTESPSASPKAAAYQTFSIDPLPTESPAADPGAASRLNDVIHSAIVHALTEKGYREQTSGAGDIRVKVHTEYYGASINAGSEQRLLAIQLYDTTKNQEIWRSNRGRTSPYTLDPASLRKGVLDMLASIPPAKVSN